MAFITPESWKEQGKYFNYISHKIFYRDSIKNTESYPPLLLLHGFPTASWDWHKLWATLSEKFSLIALDMIGFGFSDKPKEYQYSVLDQADIIELILQKNKIDNVHILAHDYGSSVALELLARHQDRVQFREDGSLLRSIALLNSGISPEIYHPKALQRTLKGPFGKYAAKFLTEKKFTQSMALNFSKDNTASDKELHAFWQLVVYNHGQGTIHKLIDYLRERKSYKNRWSEAIKNTNVPLRFIDGLQDTISGKEMKNRYQELILNPDVVELSQLGHYPHFEKPEVVLEHFLTFQSKMENV